MNIKNRTIFTRDNLEVLRGMESNVIDLIYLDPPFNSNRTYAAPVGSKAADATFKDAWTLDEVDGAWHDEIRAKQPALYYVIEAAGSAYDSSMKAYLIMMSIRLIEMKRILKDTGSIYLHCDPTASHYLKLVLDVLFGKDNFQNEIVWCYKSGGASPSKRFSKKHDIILLYTKSSKYKFISQKEKSYNRGLAPYKFKNVKEYKDEWGWYTLVGMKDYWNIDMVGRTSKERTGYPTQKPLALVKRIIEASSNKNDIVLDPFCGCATTCIAAEVLNRKWIGIDISSKAVELVKIRMEKELHIDRFEEYKIIARTDIPKRKGNRSKNIK